MFRLTDRKKTTKTRRQKELSAYIDGMISPRKRIRLEKELEKDTVLHQELDQLDLTVHLLRSLPKVPPPRSFTLDPSIYGEIRPYRIHLYPALRAASAVAVLLLIFLSAGNLMINMQSAASIAPAEMIAMEKVEYDQTTAVEEAEPEVLMMQKAAPEESLAVPQLEQETNGITVESEVVETVVVEAEVAAGEAPAMKEAPAREWTTEPQTTPGDALGATAGAVEDQAEATASGLPLASEYGNESARTLVPAPQGEIEQPVTVEEQEQPATTPLPATATPAASPAVMATPAPMPEFQATEAPVPTIAYPAEKAALPATPALTANRGEDGSQHAPIIPVEQPTDRLSIIQYGLVALSLCLLAGAYLARRFGW